MGDPSKLSPGFYFADKFFSFIFKNKSKNTIKKKSNIKSSSNLYVKFVFLYKLYFLIC